MRITIDSEWYGPITCDGPFFVQATYSSIRIFWQDPNSTEDVVATTPDQGEVLLSEFAGSPDDGEALGPGQCRYFPFFPGQQIYVRSVGDSAAVTLGVSNAIHR